MRHSLRRALALALSAFFATALYLWPVVAAAAPEATPVGQQPDGRQETPAGNAVHCRVRLGVTSPLPFQNTPMDPVIDFAALIRTAGVSGALDPNSIRVIDAKDGAAIAHATTDDFAYGDKGRVEWVIQNPSHTQYDVHFSAVPKRPLLAPQAYVPIIGVGDLLRYNAGVPRPITCFVAGLVDLRGTGRADLVGCWNYAYRPGDPWDGIVGYPRVGSTERFEFGDMLRLRYVDKPGATELKHFSHIYMACDFADFNHDGLVDLVWTRRGSGVAEFFLNTGQRDAGGLPVFTPAGSAPVSGWEACRAVDLNGDGACDLVVNGEYVKNLNPSGWPFRAAKPVQLDAGREPCFVDLDGDGRPDAVCLCGQTRPQSQGEGVVPPYVDKVYVGWRRNLGGDPPKFGPEQPLAGVDVACATLVAPAREAGKTLLLVQHDFYQQIAVFELVSKTGEKPRFARRGRAESKSAVLSLGDQAWPCLCDWNGDGVPDLLIGGGYGFPRIVVNEGTRQRPAFAEPKLLEADGAPIRFLRNEILAGPWHWHNMGYSYPVFVRWDDDDLPDLVCPNETNRIFWYKNIGTPSAPRFGPRQQVMVEGYADSPQRRAVSAERALTAVYPKEKEVPFFWRTGAALADFTGDGLTDLVTLDGENRQATLFVQFRNAQGRLRLRKSKTLKLRDGRPIDDAIVGRAAHWTESFRAVDWDGDGLIDLLYCLSSGGSEVQDGGSIYWLRNCGSKTDPVFERPVTLRCFGEPIRVTNHGPNAWAGDFDGDGKPDLIACVEWSVYPFYRHAALMMPSRPKIELGKLEIVRTGQ
jgi:hypothetical protein